MTKQRELAELRSLFGRKAVDEAIASCDEAIAWGATRFPCRICIK
jgi:hypothetical protein